MTCCEQSQFLERWVPDVRQPREIDGLSGGRLLNSKAMVRLEPHSIYIKPDNNNAFLIILSYLIHNMTLFLFEKVTLVQDGGHFPEIHN